MPEIFIVIFVVFFLFIVGMGIRQFIKNENSPVIATKARIVDKKSDLCTSTDANGAMHTSETLYLIFELDTASTMRFSVGGRVYRNAVPGEWGTLTFQGTRFLKFESESGIIEK